MFLQPICPLPCISEMFLQLNCPRVSPIVSEKSLNLNNNPSFYVQKSQSFHCSRPFPTVKISISESSPSSSSPIETRISRIARAEAQDVLFDYLHYTRNLYFTDAEHISKNSPTFLQNLLSNVDNKQEVSRSLSRFLRYNPINEFEPFFESLGLTPSELSSLVPNNLMFLSDDKILLQNFRVLCNYGIPRSNIGKMYKEESDIFRYKYGVLASKLQSYENLGLSRPTVIKLAMCCPSLLIEGVNRQFIGVLEKLTGIGIERDRIRGYLSDKSKYNWRSILGNMGFLMEMGCSKKDMERLFNSYPASLFESSGKIYVLVALLLKLGFKRHEVLFLFLQSPQILARNSTKYLWQAVNFLFEIGMEIEDIAKIIRTNMQLLGSCSLRRPKTVLSKLKVGSDRLCEIIKEDPHKLSALASKSKIIVGDRKHELPCDELRHLFEKTTFLSKLGYVENSYEMRKALKEFHGRGDRLQDRFDFLVNTGLDFHDVSKMVKVAPQVLNQTEDVIKKKIDYLVNHLGYPLQSVVAFPTYFCYRIERIKLRFSMCMWLREKGMVKPMLALSTVLIDSDSKFERTFVNRHPEGPTVWEGLKKLSSPR